MTTLSARRGLTLALACALLVGCAPRVSVPAAPPPVPIVSEREARAGEAEALFFEAVTAPLQGAPAPLLDTALLPCARALARRCGEVPQDCTRHLEASLTACGLIARPVVAHYFPRADYTSPAAWQAALSGYAKSRREEGFLVAAPGLLGEAENAGGALWLAARHDLTLTIAPQADAPSALADYAPTRPLASGEALVINGLLADDAGLVWLSWRAPNGLTREEALPLLAGRFDSLVSLSQPGTYTLELSRLEASGQRRVVGRLKLDIKAASAPESFPDAALSEDDAIVLTRGLEAMRLARHLDPTQLLVNADAELDAVLAGEATSWPQAATGLQRPYVLKAHPYLDCRLFSSYTDDSEELGPARFAAPGLAHALLAPALNAYRARVMRQGAGRRILELGCRFWNPRANPLAEWTTPESRQLWFKRQELSALIDMGLTHLDTPSERWARAKLFAALSMTAALTERRADLPAPFTRREIGGERVTASPLVDETFVVLHEARAAYARLFGAGDVRIGAFARWICLAELVQDRPDACRAEIARLAEDGGPATLIEARQAELRALIDTYAGQREQALNELLAAMDAYARLSYPLALERLAIESAALFAVPTPPAKPKPPAPRLQTPPPIETP